MLPLLLIIIISLYVQLAVLQSDQAVTLLVPPQPGPPGVTWLRNIHGEYSLVSAQSGGGRGYNFSEAAGLCHSLRSHLPFIDNRDEERELVVG